MTAAATRALLVAAGAALAVAAPFATPLSPLLPAPGDAAEHAIASAALFAAFAFGVAAPRAALFGVVLLAVLEGAVRKWVVNDATVLLLKDFVVVGIYVAVVPRLGTAERRRTPWVVVPLALLLLLALVYSVRSDSLSQALLGLRSYAVYVPLIWVAPRLLDTPRRVGGFLALILALGIGESLLATVQALTASEWLARSVPGAVPAIAASGDGAWVRPTGTFLQSGTLAAMFLFPTLVALALVMRHERGPLLASGLASLSVLSWGILYAGSRAVFAVLVLAAAALLAYLLWHRRFFAFAAVPLAFLAGYGLIATQPLLGHGDERRTVTYTYVDDSGGIGRTSFEVGHAEAQPGADVADVVGAQGGSVGRRLREQVALLFAQDLVGHGTGKMTLGSQYLRPIPDQAAESMYVKVAYELGLPALVLYVVLLCALWSAAAWASLVAFRWRRPAAVVALGAATLVPLLAAVTFALDYPFVALAFYTFTGCALAWAARQDVPEPTPTALAAPPVAPSAAASRAPS